MCFDFDFDFDFAHFQSCCDTDRVPVKDEYFYFT